MSTLVICLLIGCLFPYLTKIPLAMAMGKQTGAYDNHHPRAQQALLTGYGARALAAHKNSFESLIIYAAAILTAIATQHITPNIEILAIVYLIARVFYTFFYLADWAGLRSTVWTVGIIASLSIIYLCI